MQALSCVWIKTGGGGDASEPLAPDDDAVLESESGTQETTVSLAARESAYCGGADEKCDIRQRRQISKAREIAIGSDLLVMRRYLAVDSIFVWPKSTRTASMSPVPFKMWRAFVRRKDSMPNFS